MIGVGMDSGSARIGLTAASDDERPLRLVAPPRTIDVGHLVPLAEPYTTTWRDGSVHTYTDRRAVSEEDEDAAATAVMSFLVEVGAEILIIEQSSGIFAGKKTARAVAASATEIGHADRISVRVLERAKARGITVTTVPLATWRARVAGSARATDTEVEPHIVAGYQDWPERSTKDQRDAAGVLLWATMPPADPARRASKSRAARREQRWVDAQRLGPPAPTAEEWRAMRVALRRLDGCACTHKHRRECPYFRVGYAAPSLKKPKTNRPQVRREKSAEQIMARIPQWMLG